MVHIAPFEVEEWMDKYQPTAKYDLAETCAASISLHDLIELSENKAETTRRLEQSAVKLTYGDIRGSDALRNNLASLYSARASGMVKDNILITNGAIGANYLVLYSLVHADDHVICQYPTYEQLYRVPESFGAKVSLWKTDPTKKWQLELEELKSLLREETKMIILNNPNNPSGALITKPKLEQIVEIAKEKGIILLVDEVYRPLFHSISVGSDDFPPSAVNLGYSKAIVTGSLSKAYSLAGIRTGWIACRDRDIIETCAAKRHYHTISVSRLDDGVAAEALSDRCIHALLLRNITMAKTNLNLLENFVEEHRWACSWVKPTAGTTAMIKFHKTGKPVNDEAFCSMMHEKAGVLLCPGSKCFGGSEDFKGHIRFGFVCETSVLKPGLEAIRKFMEDEFESVPTVAR